MEASLTDDIGLLEWAFSVESNQSTRAARPLSLLLLGKVSPEVTAQEIELVLRSVPVNQAELVWSSSPWILGALRALQGSDIISSDVEPSVLLANGTVFAHEFGYKPSTVVPTCDPEAQELVSEISKPTSC